MKTLCLLSFLLMLLCPTPAQGAEPHFSRPATAEETAGLSVLSIYQDELGRMWFGTREGMDCYTPSETRHFVSEPSNPNSLCGERIRQICGDHAGHLYVLTNRGVSEYDLGTGRFRTLADRVFTALHYGKDGLWMAEYNRLFLYRDGEAAEYFRFPENVCISALLQLTTGRLAVGTTLDGAYLLDERKQTRTLLTDAPKITALGEDAEGDVWAASSVKGIYRLHGQTTAVRYHKEAADKRFRLPTNDVRSLCQADDGHVWAGTSTGLIEIAPKAHTLYAYPMQEEGGQGGRSIWTLYKDTQGSVWVGSYGGGIQWFNPGVRTYERLPFPLPGAPVSHLAGDREGGLLVCTDGKGILHYRPGPDDSWTCERIDAPANIQTVCPDPHRQAAWLGLQQGGLCRVDLQKGICTRWDRFLREQTPTGEAATVRVIRPLGTDSLLVGTHHGLYVFDCRTHTFTLYSARLHQVNPFVVDCVFDRRGRLWVAGKGLVRLEADGQTCRSYLHHPNEPTSLSSNNMEKLLVDREGRLWIATGGGGLNLYDEERDCFVRFDQSNSPLKNNFVGGLAEGTDGRLFLLHSAGLSVLQPSDRRLWNYSAESGFPFSTAYGRDLLVGDDGTVYAYGSEGLCRFHETDLRQGHIPFDLHFDALYVNNERIAPGDSTGLLGTSLPYLPRLTLRHDQTAFAVSFATSNYIRSNRCLYEYRLTGLSDRWMQIAPHTYRLNFVHLAPGHYTLEVRARWEDTGEVACSSRLPLRVTPPLYRTWWAYLLYVLILAGLVQVYLSSAKARLMLKASLVYERKEKERIKQGNQSKLRFFTNVSHEFRTPLTLILGQVETLLPLAKEHPAIYNKVWAVRRNVTYLLDLINELLEFRKYEQGHPELKVERLDLGDFLRTTAAPFAELARTRRIGLRLDLPPSGIELWADPGQLQKVVYNLLSNAFKFTPEGGCVSLSASEQGDHVGIRVSDNGIGIPADQQARIFDCFYQIDDRQPEGGHTPGTGIGLALCQQIVKAHGGRIDVESRPGEGARFSVVLRKGNAHFDPGQLHATPGSADEQCIGLLQTEPAPAEPPLPQSGPDEDDERKPCILVVEDNDELRQMLHDLFAPMYRVETAADGEEGWAKAVDTRPDLVLSDIMMPRMDGRELCRRLKESADLCHIPVVLLTARTTQENAIEGLKLGADDYVAKPFHVETLLVRCNNLVNNRRLLQQKFRQQPDTPAQVLATNTHDQAFIEKVCRIVDAHLDDPELDIPALCDAMGMGRTKFFAKLKAIAGQTPNEFVKSLRLKKACTYLREHPEMSVADIAYALGFSTPKYFGVCFHEQFGLSPTAYRNRPAGNRDGSEAPEADTD